jgi:putative addiction module component (TIGR02574 family)
MATAKSDLLTEALLLPADERLRLASELLDSVEGDEDEAWDAAWLAELDRRMSDAERDPASLKDWSEVQRAVLADLRRR